MSANSLPAEDALRKLADKKTREWPWRPIESAPKDGRHLLVIDATVGTNGFGWYEGKQVPMQTVAHWWSNPGEEGWYASVASDGEHSLRVTHWMPLPKPPATEAS